MNKLLELEAEKYARSFEKSLYGYNGESLSPEDEKQKQDFIAGATSKYVEKQKLEFAISLLLKLRAKPTSVIDDKIIELELQLEQL